MDQPDKATWCVLSWISAPADVWLSECTDPMIYQHSTWQGNLMCTILDQVMYGFPNVRTRWSIILARQPSVDYPGPTDVWLSRCTNSMICQPYESTWCIISSVVPRVSLLRSLRRLSAAIHIFLIVFRQRARRLYKAALQKWRLLVWRSETARYYISHVRITG